MTEQHPITPPPKLVSQWVLKSAKRNVPDQVYIATEAARWGADQELEACCDVIARELNDFDGEYIAGDLRTERRPKPKPPSLKEQALEDLEEIDCCAVDQLSAYVIHGDLKRRVSNIRRALEALTDA